ncbi:MAG: thioredoxin family protein [Candidatus Peribacteraceae bacterium]|nr:thioredoxin family protein [Candidatus Peribacteraceae bacterium]
MRPSSFLSAALLFAAAVPPALAVRADLYQLEIPKQAGYSASSNSSLRKAPLSSRDTRRQMRLEWRKREAGERSVSSSSSSAITGTFPLQPYSAGSLGKGQPAALFFCSDWSTRCQNMVKMLRQWGESRPFVIPAYHVDYDKEKELRSRFGVTHINTFVAVDGKGELLRFLENPQEVTMKYFLYAE